MTKETVMATNKEKLVAEAIEMKLGTKEFLTGLKEDNLVTMVEATRVRDSKLKDNQKVISAGKENAPVEGTTSVDDLLRLGRIRSNKVMSDERAKEAKKAKKDK